MSLKETMKAERLREKAKLKNMSFQDKLWYIWEYYKWHIGGLLIVLVVISQIGAGIYRSTFTTQFTYVLMNNISSTEDHLADWHQNFKDRMGFGEKDVIEADTSLMITHDEMASELTYANLAKMSAMVASKDLDVIIADQANVDHYQQLGAFMDLEQLLPADLWEQVKAQAYYQTDEEGNTFACAIDITKSRYVQDNNFSLNPCYLGVVSNSQHIDTAIEWVRFVVSAP